MGLCLTRKENEVLHLGPTITVTVLEARGGKARILVDAPPDVIIRRAELSAGEARGLRRKEGA